MSKFFQYLTNIATVVAFLASLATLAGVFTPPPPATLTLPLIILQCR